MIDIKQEELDKAFVDGMVAADDAILKVIRNHVTPEVFDAAAQAVYDTMVERIGLDRLNAMQGPNEREPRA